MGRRMTPLATLVPAERRIAPCTASVARVTFPDYEALQAAATATVGTAEGGSRWSLGILRLGARSPGPAQPASAVSPAPSAAGWLRSALLSILGGAPFTAPSDSAGRSPRLL
jgi:hypothetical protein